MSSSSPSFTPPSSILIVGSGVFGVSTALALSQRPAYASTTITLLDRSPFPNPYAASIDIARIVRADYSDPAYADLAERGLREWRKQGPDDLGGDGRYTESGLVLAGDDGTPGMAYVQASYDNVCALAAAAGDDAAIVELPTTAALAAQVARHVGPGTRVGDWGYLNRRSGWAHAERATTFVRRRVERLGRVRCAQGDVVRLRRDAAAAPQTVTGVELADGRTLCADVVVLATGAWTGALVDLRGRATATGQALAYMQLAAGEQAPLADMPVILNLSSGMFVVPPTPDGTFRIARHAYGLSNPCDIAHPDGTTAATISASLPIRRGPQSVAEQQAPPHDPMPAEALAACRQGLRDMVPRLEAREFTRTRLCWYTDTPTGDFLITYHPASNGSLFLATGGSGHGFKFLPVIGDCIVDTIEGHCPAAFQDKWAWPAEPVENVVVYDGSRGGLPGLVLNEEMRKGTV